MRNLSLTDEYTIKAIHGLEVFRDYFCFDCENSAYRCKKCPFENHKTNVCIIKKFISENKPKS